MTGGGAWPRRGGAVLGAGSQLALSVRGWGLSPGGVASYGGGLCQLSVGVVSPWGCGLIPGGCGSVGGVGLKGRGFCHYLQLWMGWGGALWVEPLQGVGSVVLGVWPLTGGGTFPHSQLWSLSQAGGASCRGVVSLGGWGLPCGCGLLGGACPDEGWGLSQ